MWDITGWGKKMPENNGMVSIIVPVYNVERYFDECINSLLEQTYKNIEIIIVDDGTKDNCGKKADEYAKRDKRIVSVHKENGGLSSARNYGIKFATGDYLCFVDSDDYVSPEYIEKMVAVAAEKKADMVFCNFSASYVNKDIPNWRLLALSEKKEYTPQEYLDHLYVYSGAFTEVWNKIYRSDIFKTLRFVDIIGEDAQIMLSVIDNCKQIYYVPEVLYYYRRRNNSIANDKQETILLNEMKWINEHMKKLKATKRMHHYSLALKLLISKIIEKYCFCKKETRKKLKPVLRRRRKELMDNNEFGLKIKLKYFLVSLFPYVYGKIKAVSYREKNIYWD